MSILPFPSSRPICPPDQPEIQYAAVRFSGPAPTHWRGFEEEEGAWGALPSERRHSMAEELQKALLAGKVTSLVLSFDPYGEDYFLAADFAGGWAALLYNVLDDYALSPYQPQLGEGDALVRLGGQTLVPRQFALETRQKAAEAILFLLRRGCLWLQIQWAASSDGGLPWESC